MPYHVAYPDVAFRKNIERIKLLFAEADADGSGFLNLEELHTAMMEPQMRKSFAAVGIQPHQTDLVFQVMDINDDGELNLQEFIDGLVQITEPDGDGICGDIDATQLFAANRRKFLQAQAAKRRQRAEPSADRPTTAPAEVGRHSLKETMSAGKTLIEELEERRCSFAERRQSVSTSRRRLAVIFDQNAGNNSLAASLVSRRSLTAQF